MGDKRTEQIVHTLDQAFESLMARDPGAFRRRFRKMAADPFAFYRGSACLFYADMVEHDDPWVDERTSRVWIHGDLHAENFGTYMNSRGLLVFDVNDFDEAYLGRFTWDLLRCSASLALLGWRKAFPDATISEIIARYAQGYLDQVRRYAESDQDLAWALRLDNADGPVATTLEKARAANRLALLDRETVIVDGERRFRDGDGVRHLDADERSRVESAYARYLDTIPEDKRLDREVAYEIKDVVARSGLGIGSAGLGAYSLLIEGRSQALENDVILSMKEGNTAAPSAIVHDPRLVDAFAHHGHRTALSQRALQAFADPFLGWTELGETGYVVRELSPFETDLDWDDLTEPAAIARLTTDLGRATAKVHCVSDADAEAIIVDEQVEDLLEQRLDGAEQDFTAWLTEFALSYAETTRADHSRFVDAFRAGAFRNVSAT